MKQTPLGENRAETADDINAIIEEAGFLPDSLHARIEHEDFTPSGEGETGVNMTGHSAEIFDNDDGETIVTTVGFQEREDLEAILNEVGIEIQD